MHIETYDSHEEMQEALRRHQEHALAGLHDVQANLTWGDHWVRFVDLDAKPPVVEFGRVSTREEIAHLELSQGGGVNPEAKWGEIVGVIDDLEQRQAEGYLFGLASSVLGTELGTSHKSLVWPIEERLYDLAKRADWNINRLDELGRFLLDLAFRQHRAHFRAMRQEGRL